MNVESLIESGMLVERDGKLYKNGNTKTILTMYNALNATHPIKLGTLRTWLDRHHVKSISLLSEDQCPVEDEY